MRGLFQALLLAALCAVAAATSSAGIAAERGLPNGWVPRREADGSLTFAAPGALVAGSEAFAAACATPIGDVALLAAQICDAIGENADHGPAALFAVPAHGAQTSRNLRVVDEDGVPAPCDGAVLNARCGPELSMASPGTDDAAVGSTLYGAVLWKATLLPGHTNATLAAALASFFWVNATRVHVTHVTAPANATTAGPVVDFEFTALPPHSAGISRTTLQLMLGWMDREALEDSFGIASLSSNATRHHRPAAWAVALTNGTAATNGLVRVRPLERNTAEYPWGTVCSHDFGAVDGDAVCRSLGMLSPGRPAQIHRYRGGGTGPIYMDDVDCRSPEALQNCSYTYSSPTIREHDCTHDDDVAVDCDPGAFRFSVPKGLGLLTATANGTTGAVCPDAVSVFGGAVGLCRAMGYDVHEALLIERYGSQSRDMVLSCFNNSMETCRIAPTSDATCFAYEAVAIDCRGQMQPPNFDTWHVHLDADPTKPGIGLLQVRPFRTDAWGGVCSGGFGPEDALAACHSTGHNVKQALAIPYYGAREHTKMLLSAVNCSGLPWNATLGECRALATTSVTYRHCVPGYAVGLDCTGTPPTSNAPEMLWTVAVTGSPTGDAFRGDLALFLSIDDDRVVVTNVTANTTAAALETIQFRFVAAPAARHYRELTRGDLDLRFSALVRGGGIAALGIAAAEDNTTGVLPAMPNMGVRITGGKAPGEGLLQVRPSPDAPWGTVCKDTFSTFDAMAACRSAGFPQALYATVVPAPPGVANRSSPIYMNGVMCGREDTLAQCRYLYSPPGAPANDCTHHFDVGVRCVLPTPPVPPFGSTIVTAATTFTEERLTKALSFRFAEPADVVAFVSFKANGTNNTAVFFFTDPAPSVSRHRSNLILSALETMTAADRLKYFGISMIAFAAPPPPTYPSPDGWEAKIFGGGRKGLLLVRPNASLPWGTVCDDGFYYKDAAAACHMAGYPVREARYLMSEGTNVKNYSTAPIYMDDVVCGSNASIGLGHCTYTYSPLGWPRSNCRASEAVGVDCSLPVTPDPTLWQFRLAGNHTPGRGRLEVQPSPDAAWGTVCDDGFRSVDALAACRSLGYNVTFALPIPGFGGGSGVIILDDVRCQPGDYLQNCSVVYSTANNSWSNCGHWEDVGVDCTGVAPTSDFPVIAYTAVLRNASHPGPAVVEAVADFLWINETRVVILGTTTDGVEASEVAVSFLFKDPPLPEWNTALSRKDINIQLSDADAGVLKYRLHFVSLTSNDTSRAPMKGWEVTYLNNNFTEHAKGIVMVRPGPGTPWGAVCDRGFTDVDAAAACRSFGFTDVTKPKVYTAAPAVARTIRGVYATNVDCGMSADFLQNCSALAWTPAATNLTGCGTDHAVGVECYPDGFPFTFHFRLADGPNNRSGRLEVRPGTDAPWGTVCNDNFDATAALAACHSLGFTNLTKARLQSFATSPGTGPIYMDDVKCGPGDATLPECTFLYSTATDKRNNCNHFEDVGVDCNAPPSTDPAAWTLRLAGDQPDIGRVEIQPSPGMPWGSVCSLGFTSDDAVATCKALGYNVSIAIYVPNYGGGDGPVYLSKVDCEPGQSLRECSFVYSTPNNTWTRCTKYEAVGVDCSGNVPTSDAEVVLYTATFNGTFNATWFRAQVADQFWVKPDRTVVTSVAGNVVQFTFADPTPQDWHTALSRADLDFYFTHVSRAGLRSTFHILELSSNSSRTRRYPDMGVRIKSVTGDPRVGVLEVQPTPSDAWGTVCNDGFAAVEALAACHSAGFFPDVARRAPNVVPFVNRTGPQWLSSIDCSAEEAFLQNCSYTNATFARGCSHMDDTYIDCRGTPRWEPRFIKSIGGTGHGNNTGVLQVRPHPTAEWGFLCMPSFSNTDALAVCHSLGFTKLTGATAVPHTFDLDPGVTYSTTLACDGSLFENCTTVSGYQVLHTPTELCSLVDRIGVDCTSTDPARWTVRVEPSAADTPARGRLSIRPSPEDPWGDVCSPHFDDIDARAACRSAGFGDVPNAYAIPDMGDSVPRPMYLSDVDCESNNATYLQNCSTVFTPVSGTVPCWGREAVGVDCSNTVPPATLPIALIATIESSRAPVFADDLCTYFFVERWRYLNVSQEGNGTAGFLEVTFMFAPRNASAQISADNLNFMLLNANERALRDDLGIITLTSNVSEAIKPTMQFRLLNASGGPSATPAGLLQIRPSERTAWGTVCRDGFDQIAATAACHSLGYGNPTVHYRFAGGGGVQARGPIYIDDTSCGAGDTYFQNCTFTYSDAAHDALHNCVHSEDIMLDCAALEPQALQLRLVPSAASPRVGLLEVRANSSTPWGGICTFGFNEIAATAACRSVGLPVPRARYIVGYRAVNVSANFSIVISDTNCRHATGPYLQNCTLTDRFADLCTMDDLVGLDCSVPPPIVTSIVPSGSSARDRVRGRLIANATDTGATGTVCSTGFGPAEALAACRGAGYAVDQAYPIPYYGGGAPGQMLLGGVECSANRSSLDECAFTLNTTLSPVRCQEWAAVGVDCSGTPMDFSPRILWSAVLSNVTAPRLTFALAAYFGIAPGRVELVDLRSYDGHSAGLQSALDDPQALADARTSVGDPLSQVDFMFTDRTSPAQPPRADLDFTLLDTSYNVIVREFDLTKLWSNVSSAVKKTMEFRLTEGTVSSGILQIRPYADAAWGSVCNDGFDVEAARAACRSLGFENPTPAIIGTQQFPSQGGTIYIDETKCGAGDTYFQNCSFTYSTAYSPKLHNCFHFEDVAIDCLAPPPAVTAPFEFRLVPKENHSRIGLLEARRTDTAAPMWGLVCAFGFTKAAAARACRSVGFDVKSASFVNGYRPAPDIDVVVGQTDCFDAPGSLLQNCSLSGDTTGFCSSLDAVGIDCSPSPVWTARIAPLHPSQPWLGRLEVSPGPAAVWGTVCSDGFDDADALVACRTAGYDNISSAIAMPNYGGGTGRIYMRDLQCGPGASVLTNCSADYDAAFCYHWQDVGVDCSGATPAAAPLILYTAVTPAPGVNLTTAISDYLFVPHRVVATNITPATDGNVSVSFYFTDSRVSPTRRDLDFMLLGTSPVALRDDLDIFSLTSNVSDSIKPTMQFRLVGAGGATGPDVEAGVVQMRPDAESGWGTMCDDGFNAASRTALCHSLGFAAPRPAAMSAADFPIQGGAIYVDNTRCAAGDTYFQNCSFTYSEVTYRRLHDCTHNEDVAIDCMAQEEAWQFRLVPQPGDNARVGLLEARNVPTAKWGTVCGIGFDDAAALTACRSVGYPSKVARFIFGYPGANATQPIAATVRCNETAASLANCSLDTAPSRFCRHFEDVGLDCRDDEAGWQFQLAADSESSLPDRGTFLVRTAPGKPLQSACSAGFSDGDALAACHSLGYRVASAFALPYYGAAAGVVNGFGAVRCAPDDQYFQNCSFERATATRALGCGSAVGVDCSGTARPAPPVIAFTALVEPADAPGLLAAIAGWLYVPAARVASLGADVPVGARVGVRFVVTDGGHSSFDSREALDGTLLAAPAAQLQDDLRIIELTSNVSTAVRRTMQFRLFGGASGSQGVVQVRPDSTAAWGTVCDDGFDQRAADAVCASLGMHGPAELLRGADYGGHFGPIYVDDTKCGNATGPYQDVCDFVFSPATSKKHNCGHAEDVAIACTTVTPTKYETQDYHATIVNPATFDAAIFSAALAKQFGVPASAVVSVHVRGETVTFRIKATRPVLDRIADSVNGGRVDQGALGVAGLAAATAAPAPPPDSSGTPWVYVGVGCGAVALIVAVAAAAVVLRRRRKSTTTGESESGRWGDEDYVAMMDYRPPEV